MEPSIIVHGGAWNIPKRKHESHLEGCRRAVEEGIEFLLDGMSALDTIERAVRLLEDHPVFDAGFGSFLNAAGEVEIDAMIMDGTDLRFGAVGSVQCIRHSVSQEREVLEDGRHSMLVGKGALRFARRIGMETVTSKELLMDRELERWKEIQLDGTFTSRRIFEMEGLTMGTVGAVAIDSAGRIAAAASTGGTPNKLPGRNGDSPLIGCGTYADDCTAGVSATGWGESIMKVTLARRVCDLVERGYDAMRLSGLQSRTWRRGSMALVA
ncbi:MAG TPA: isoaspartyl peptidase/L-asparaginase [Methanomassiliicoccales archaeon]|nr:isoaspartyl peptidase/L-asparaginase [Methanomassiliicoccales archaeon]